MTSRGTHRLLWGLILAATVAAQPAVVVSAGSDRVSQAQLRAVEAAVGTAIDRLAPKVLGHRPQPFRVIVHRTEDSIPSAVRDSLHEGTAGVALLGPQQIHLVLEALRDRPPDDLSTVVTHEAVHILLHQRAGEAGVYIPRWLHEGLAQELSGPASLGVSEEEIAFRAATGTLLMFSRLEQGFPSGGSALRVAYAQSFSFVSYLRSLVGLDALLSAACGCGPGTDIHSAFAAATGRVLLYAERDWVDYLRTGSGAGFRVLLASCFSLLLVAALPLLALAGIRRWNRDHAAARRLELAEEAALGVSPGAGAGDDPDP
jgi:hypothetical protein